MYSLEPFKIDLKGLKEGNAELDFNLKDDYFEAIDAPEVRKGDVAVKLSIQETGEHYFSLNFHIAGEVTVLCDRCLDEMRQKIESDNRLVAKFGEENSEDDDLVIVEESEGIIDVAWYIYEFIALSIPMQHVHENVEECNSEMINKLAEHAAANVADEDSDKLVDPRWSGLEKLKTILND